MYDGAYGKLSRKLDVLEDARLALFRVVIVAVEEREERHVVGGVLEAQDARVLLQRPPEPLRPIQNHGQRVWDDHLEQTMEKLAVVNVKGRKTFLNQVGSETQKNNGKTMTLWTKNSWIRCTCVWDDCLQTHKRGTLLL